MKKKLVRITTVPISLRILLEGQLEYMSNHFEVIAISSNEKILNEIGEKSGVKTYAIELSRKITPISDLKALFKLYFFLKKLKPDIVHTHTPKAGTIGMIAAKMAGVANRLHTIAGLPLLVEKGIKRKILNFVEKITYACATKIYPNSFGLKEIILEEKFTTNEKLKVIGNGSSNGIDIEHFDPDNVSSKKKIELKEELNISKDDFVFVFVGRLVTDKGINELVKVFDDLNKTNNNIKLLLVGFFEKELDPLSKKTMNLLNNKNIISVGHQKDVRPYFAISDVLTFPSYREGFPNVVMQAGAMGLPSIVSNINGCNEIIIENINGNIIPVMDEKALSEKMKFYMDNSNECHKMRTISRKMIVDRYKRNVICEALLKEYESLDS
jgi:glycosyltransferase involved in cell wall biosynthesis